MKRIILALLLTGAAAYGQSYYPARRATVLGGAVNFGDKVLVSDWHGGLVLWMPFPSQPLAGTYYDYGRLGNDGTQTNAASRPTWSSGAYTFDGDDHIRITDNTALNMANNDFTVTAWLKTTNAGVQTVCINGRRYAEGKRYHAYLSTGRICLNIDDDVSSLIILSDKLTYNDGGWHLATVMRNGNVMRLYGDGIVNAAPIDISGVGSLNDTSGLAAVGIANSAANVLSEVAFRGTLDDVRIYTRALTSNEVFTIWKITRH